MFKKLVVGALAAGIALTGGIGAASASTENTASATLANECWAFDHITYLGDNKYEKLNILIIRFTLIHMMSKFVEEQCIGILKVLIVMEGLFMKDDL
ncbi:hypothetical protein [Bacillus sp. SH8-8]|uniref:hypothetical protein n=1 Tax=Bacillus sp. SH8-8 TaxID=2217830 RepID=UPI0034D768D4